MGDSQRSGDATDETPQVLRMLREAFDVESDSAVIRRALGLARFMANAAADDHTVTVIDRNGTPVKLLLNG